MSGKLKTYFTDLRNEYPVIRAVFGVSLALVFATTVQYPAPHLTAILTLMFLGPGKQALGLKMEIIIPLLIYIFGSVGVFLGNELIDYPLVILPLLALAIFWSFKLVKLVQIPSPVRLVFLMLTVLIPFNSITANALGGIILKVLLLNVIIAFIIVKISFIFFPDKPTDTEGAKKKKSGGAAEIDMNKVAFNGVMVIFPIVVLFYIFNATVGLLTLVFTVILGFDPFIYQSKKGLVIIVANLLGGFFGILAYQLLIVVPDYLFYIFLTLSIAFFFMINLFSGKKIAPVFATSFNTFIVIMGIISTSTSGAGNELWSRLAQIGVAVVYTTLAYIVVTAFNNPKISKVEE